MANLNKPTAGSAIYPGRLMALTDGVFAIVMTLLVLGLGIPVFTGSSIQQDFAQLLAMWPRFACYFITFILLGFIWSVHHYLFGLLKHSDSVLVWLNIIFLMFASLLPFSTSLLAEYLGQLLPLLIYEGNFFMLQLAGFASFLYATGKYRLLDPTIGSHEVTARRISWLVGIVLVAVAIGVSFMNIIVSIGLFVVTLFMDVTFMVLRFRIQIALQEVKQDNV